ncbi:MAG: hypothetical protein RLZ10_1791 [Bacteroidota bacterium]|jgi:hypothetical protein
MTKQELKNLIKEVIQELDSVPMSGVKKEPTWTVGLKKTNQPRIPSDNKDLQYLKNKGLSVVIRSMGDFVGELPNMTANLKVDGKMLRTIGLDVDKSVHGSDIANKLRNLSYAYQSNSEVDIEDFIKGLVASSEEEVRQSTPTFMGRRRTSSEKYPIFNNEKDQLNYLISSAKNVFGSDITITVLS